MAPIAANLARSESKAKFFARIGLEENNRIHRQLYATMKAEAVQGWLRMTSTRDALVPALKDDPSVEPPYTYAQINESAMRAEVMRIHEQASAETRILYNLAYDENIAADDNWIIRWLLWHVFRYRDDRNCSVNRAGRSVYSVESPSTHKQRPASLALRTSRPQQPQRQVAASTAHVDRSAYTVRQTKYWDPVREKFREQ